MTISVLIVDDHKVFAETLAASLGLQEDIEIAGTVNSAEEGASSAAAIQPDVALLDVGLPDADGIELARRLRNQSPGTRVVMLTGNTDVTLFPRAMAAGACGYLLKDAGLGEVLDAVRRAAAGQVVVPDGVAGLLSAPQPAKSGIGSDLTKRELEVLRLLAEGFDARTIGNAIGVTWHTSRSYVKSLLMKLDAHSQLEAVAKATRLGIITTGPAA